MLAEVLAAGYAGPPPLTVWRGFTSWSVSAAVPVVVVLAVGYLAGARALRGRGAAWPRSRYWSFLLGGLGSLLVVTAGPVGCYAGVLFWMRAVQNVTLLMIVPMFLAMGAPLSMVRDLAPAGPRAALGRLLRSPWARRLTFPLVITPVFVGPLPLIYLTPIYPASLAHTWVGVLVGLWLLGAGWLYFWTRFRIDPTPRTDTHLITLGISVAEVVLDGALGLAVWLGPLIAARYYQELARPWGPDLRTDQIIGAGILWIGGDLAGFPFLAVVMRRMSREDAAQAAEIDAELDRQDSERAARRAEHPAEGLDPSDPGFDPSAAGSPGSPGPAGEPERPRLWWEDHPELAERFRRR